MLISLPPTIRIELYKKMKTKIAAMIIAAISKAEDISMVIIIG